MNYRHIYHAGNFADVFKHLVLIMLIQDLGKKDKSILFMDTHAGIGKYDLSSNSAQKTCEYTQGFLRLYKQDHGLNSYPEVINIYKNIIESLNCNKDLLTSYPGSPWIFKVLMRTQDQAILTELHKEDIITLKHNFYKDKQIAVHHINGYTALKAFLPPKCGRGLILIDPPFEDKNEFAQVLSGLELALERFSNGTYIIWYPIKDGIEVREFYKKLEQLKFKNILIREFGLTKDRPITGLNKCGIAIINSPWQFEIELNKVIEYLKKIF